jgi:hypothetical protein
VLDQRNQPKTDLRRQSKKGWTALVSEQAIYKRLAESEDGQRQLRAEPRKR